jgi:hypothetical protein
MRHHSTPKELIMLSNKNKGSEIVITRSCIVGHPALTHLHSVACGLVGKCACDFG